MQGHFWFHVIEQLIKNFDEISMTLKFYYKKCYMIISWIIEENLVVCTKNINKFP